MAAALMVPVRMDALYVAASKSQAVVAPDADFSGLPHALADRDVNADTANLSANVQSTLFEDETLVLKPGLHLHWALPDAFTRGAQSAVGTDFPTVPNRWLVARRRGLSATVEAAWVVESDFLWPEGSANPQGSITVPVKPDPARGHRVPFRYQGRKIPLANWQPSDPSAEYVSRLTALGYGAPTFAAFYPNCHSVFGFHDPDYTAPAVFVYDLIGWFGDPDKDPLGQMTSTILSARAEARPLADRWLQALREQLNWQATVESGHELPSVVVCCARLQVSPAQGSLDNPARVDPQLEVTVASTGTEALSARLAQKIDKDRKAIIEDQLEALQLTSRLENRQLDVGPKFREARHEKGFVAVRGGTLWTVVSSRSGAAGGPGAEQGSMAEQLTLPDPLAAALNTLNSWQREYDDSTQEITSLRRQLFADWYKYMLCVHPPDDARDDYPDPDLARHFIQTKGVQPLSTKVATTGVLSLQAAAGGGVAGASDLSGATGSQAALVARAVTTLLEQLTAFNRSDAVQTAGVAYSLRATSAPRYWMAREPVVLLTGAAAEPTDRHGRDGALPCTARPGFTSVPALLANLPALLQSIPAEAVETWTGQPWHPFRLDWETELFPLALGTNLGTTGAYQGSFITESHDLPLNGCDLVQKPGAGALSTQSSIYSGTSLLTPHAQLLLTGQLEAYLEQKGVDRTSDAYRTFQSALQLLEAPGFHCLSQSLGGFSEALLMHRLTPQLPVADPLGFDADRAFTQAAANAIGNANDIEPQPLSDFNPLRTGAMRLLQLRLVDTFGQVRNVDCSQVLTCEPLKVPGDNKLIALPPRLAQPARVDLRWLSASADQEEMNAHPATSPICGWLLPNNLDNSLVISNAEGEPLGQIDSQGRWRGVAGAQAIDPTAVANPHLRRMVSYLLGQSTQYQADFLSVIDSSLENIDPENFAQHQDLALLMGRPVALVRAALTLELQGLPAAHQGWNNFRDDIMSEGRDDNGFTEVGFPIRLGEHGQLNDGLVGYWIERDGDYANGIFYAPESDSVQDPQLQTSGDHPAPIVRTLQDPPLILSMLIDPRANVQATAGILPAKVINVPPDQYLPALQKLQVAFLTAPVITDVGALKLPLPREPGSSWSWMPGGAAISNVDLEARFGAPQEIREGWLILSNDDK